MRAFREAVEADDHRAMEALLADDVRFTSPVAFKPYDGKAITAAILRAVTRVFEDFHYVREIRSADDRDHALVFEASILKAIGSADDDFEQRVVAAVAALLAAPSDLDYSVRATKGGRHIAVTLDITVQTAEQVRSIYGEIHEVRGLKLLF